MAGLVEIAECDSGIVRIVGIDQECHASVYWWSSSILTDVPGDCARDAECNTNGTTEGKSCSTPDKDSDHRAEPSPQHESGANQGVMIGSVRLLAHEKRIHSVH